MRLFVKQYLPGIFMLGLWFASFLWLASRLISAL